MKKFTPYQAQFEETLRREARRGIDRVLDIGNPPRAAESLLTQL